MPFFESFYILTILIHHLLFPWRLRAHCFTLSNRANVFDLAGE